MGLTLTNEQIDLTYPGLIKMNDNVAITGVLKPLSDGVGNNLPIEVSTTGVNFTGTVTGITTGGLVAGSGTDSMRSADALTTVAAIASGTNSIAIGDRCEATTTGGIAIGSNAKSGTQSESVSIGNNINGITGPFFAIGRNSVVSGSASVSIGNSMNVTAFNAIGISGEIGNVGPSASRSIGIGRQVTVNTQNSTAIGNFAKVTGLASMSFTSCSLNTNEQKAANSLMMVPGNHGCTTNAAASDSIVLGSSSSQLERASAAAVQGIAIGYDTQTTAAGAVALGNGVVANKDATVSVTELEVQLNGGGISMFSPNGTEYKLTVSDAGALVIT